MSEPLSSTEIEDVLSSIRRLVSDDLRPLQRQAPASPPAVSAEKLILTPALRVVQDSVAPVVQAHLSSPNRLHLGLPAQSPAPGLDQVVASVGAAVDAQSLEWEAETGDAPPFAAAPQTDDWQDAEFASPAVVFADASGEVTPSEEPAVVTYGSDEVLSSDRFDDDMAPAHSDGGAQMPGWAQQDVDPDVDVPIEDVAVPDVSHGTIEPDPAWADAAEASVIASLAADLADNDAMGEASPAEFGDDPMLFDEEVLRELVRDILREELAGQMGERITRNIRKLVRAEIARSFATQEFE